MKTVSDCIRSIQAQSLNSWELIAVDDYSQDGTREEVRFFAKNDPRIKVYKNQGAGIVDALNTAIHLSVGEFIARMDADDIMHEDRLSLQYDFLINNKSIGLISSLVSHKENNEADSRGYGRYVNWINSLKEPQEISNNRFIESPVAHPSVMFRKELLSFFGSYRKGEFPEDYELWLRFLKNGVKMAKINRYLLIWNDHANRLSRNDRRYKLPAFQKIKAQYASQWIIDQKMPQVPVHVWGHGKNAKRQTKLLKQYGVNIEVAYETDSKKFGHDEDGVEITHYERIPEKGKVFILVLIGSMGIRSQIGQYLKDRGHQNGKDYLFMA